MRVVYNSFHGRFTDNPRAVWERLAGRPGLEHVWLTDAAHAAAFPAEVETVDIDGPAARALLESADVLVANSHTEVEWEKPSGTRYLQTWHGTPLKRIHRDVLWAPEGRLDRLDDDVARWDLLLSPNPESTPRLRQAFRFDRPVVETGYPRNDLLSDPEGQQVRDRLRAGWGIGPDETAVLYTPTWRDRDVFGSTDPLALPLDLGPLVSGLPGTRLLVRAHYMLTQRLVVDSLPGVHDVSAYPDIRDLYLAADVLVTDYSSTMFDFAVTGRPLIFYCPDLDEFRDTIRGFYFDFVPLAPGPVVQTGEELLGALGDLPAVQEQYAERYASFRERFCSLEDGHATDRVLDLLGLGAG